MLDEKRLERGVKISVLVPENLRRFRQRLLPRLLVRVELLDVVAPVEFERAHNIFETDFNSPI